MDTYVITMSFTVQVPEGERPLTLDFDNEGIYVKDASGKCITHAVVESIDTEDVSAA